MSNNDLILEVEKVSSGYGQSQVLFDVTLSCPKKGAIAILGRNGAGKSTLLKTIASEIDPIGGNIIFDGTNTTNETTDKTVRRGMAYVPQEDAVWCGDNGDADVRTLRRVAKWHAAPRTRAQRLIHRVGR